MSDPWRQPPTMPATPTTSSTKTSGNPFDGLTTMNLDLIDAQGMTLIYKGHSGSGKTYNALTWPGPIIYVMTDLNQATLRQKLKELEKAGRKGEIQPIYIDSWRDYADKLIPKLANRMFPTGTVVIDTFDMLAHKMWGDIQGSSKRLTQADFGVGLNRLMDTTTQLVESAINRGDGTSYYNIVVCTHLTDVTDDQGNLLRTTPAVMGRFKDTLEDFFDYSLLCESEAKRTNSTSGGRSISTLSKSFKCYSVAPTRHHTAKGGNLPPVFGPGTYPEIKNLLENPKQGS